MKKTMAKSMITGKPISLILRFALPLLLGNLFQQTYNMVDAAIVGQTLGAEALGAVGASTSVQFLVLGFCIGTCAGFAIPIAQTFGAGKLSHLRKYIYHAILLTVLFGAVITTVCALLCSQILHALRTPDELFKDAYIYLLIIFLGIPCNLTYNLCSSILRAVGDSRTPFLFLACSAVLNIGLDFVCIMGLHMGTAGAAIATIFSQGLSGVLCILLIRKKYDFLRLQPEEKKWERHFAHILVVMGVPMGLQYSITAIGSMVMQGANNSLGPVYVSGFAAGMKIKQLAMCPFDALATGVSTFAGQNYGAGKIDRVKKGIREGVIAGVLYGIGIGLVLIFFGRTMSLMFVKPDAVAVLDASGQYLRSLGYFYWTLGILNVCRMSVQGLGYSMRAVVGGILEMIARIVVSFCFVPVFGFNAICFSDQSAWIAAATYMAIMLRICLKKIETRQAGAV